MTPPTATASADDKVFEFSDSQLKAAIDRRLKDLGLTLEQLRSQAAAGNFPSAAARKLWYLIRGTH